MGGKHVLGYRGTRSQTELTVVFIVQQVHVVLQLTVFGKNAFAMLQQHITRLGQRNLVAEPVEQTGLIQALQLAYVLGNGRLADEQLLRSFGKAQVFRHTVEYFQTEIGHL